MPTCTGYVEACDVELTQKDKCGLCEQCLAMELEFAYQEEHEARKNLDKAQKRVFELGGSL